MSTFMAGIVRCDTGFAVGVNPHGTANTYYQFKKLTTAIADNTATTVATLSIPNINQSCVLRILIRSAITNASHTYDSTRVAEYTGVVTRVAGAAAVVVLSSVIGAQIATSSGGQTLTTALSAAAIGGGVTATNTCALQITNVNASAGTTETEIFVELINGAGTFAFGATAPTGVTIS